TATTRTRPEAPQPGGAFGLEQVQWDAWMMRSGRDQTSPVLDLLEWTVPTPAGQPVSDPTAPGLNRLCIATPDLDAQYERLLAAGADVWSEPVEVELAGGRL